jgi:hypothetical protein
MKSFRLYILMNRLGLEFAPLRNPRELLVYGVWGVYKNTPRKNNLSETKIEVSGVKLEIIKS